jgi:hypothetical protein
MLTEDQKFMIVGKVCDTFVKRLGEALDKMCEDLKLEGHVHLDVALTHCEGKTGAARPEPCPDGLKFNADKGVN